MSDTPQRQSWDLETAFDQRASKEAQAEANAFRTVPTGSYRFTPEKMERYLSDEKSPFGDGLRIVKVTYNGVAKFQLADKTPKGKFFVEYSIDERKQDTAQGQKLIPPSALYLQAQKALEKADATHAETIEALGLYPVDAYVTESLVYEGQGEGTGRNGKPKNRYENVKADGSRNEVLAKGQAAGGKAVNFVQNVSKIKN